jgi:hypothetical protein
MKLSFQKKEYDVHLLDNDNYMFMYDDNDERLFFIVNKKQFDILVDNGLKGIKNENKVH